MLVQMKRKKRTSIKSATFDDEPLSVKLLTISLILLVLAALIYNSC